MKWQSRAFVLLIGAVTPIAQSEDFSNGISTELVKPVFQ
jgi:hypothetical protein